MSDESEKKPETITTKIWDEVPEEDNPFAAKICYCSGYDVYGDLLGKVNWVEYLYLLFKLERPTEKQRQLLEGLAVALANPGPRDHSVRAAMNAGVGGSTHASALMAALAVGAGNLGGGREVFLGAQLWMQCGTDLDEWFKSINNPSAYEVDTWHEMEHFPGFDPNGIKAETIVLQTLHHLAEFSHDAGALAWLRENRLQLEGEVGSPLAMSGVATAALADLGFSPSMAEMLFLLLRLPGAAAHSMEQNDYGWRRYPFFADGLHLVEGKER